MARLLAAVAPLGAKLADVTDDRTRASCPPSAESTEVFKLQKERFASGQTVTGLIVYQREGGLTEADQARIARTPPPPRRALPVDAPAPCRSRRARRPASSPPTASLPYTVVTVPTTSRQVGDWGKDVREASSGDGGGGLRST